MKNKKLFIINIFLITVISIIVTVTGILSNSGSGETIYQSIRGEEIIIYGKGIYKDMSSGLAIQGIAQDYVTLFIAIPVLLISLYFALNNSKKALFVLSGTLGYFTLTYLFYTGMAMYNAMFLLYVALLGLSLTTFITSFFNFDLKDVKLTFENSIVIRNAGIFLIINGSLIAMLWLSIIIPPLLNGSIIPKEVEHYTTLIVQGYDLGIFLPFAFISGILTLRKSTYGYLFTMVYLVFLSFIMLALISKIVFIANTGANVIPAILIIPIIFVSALTFTILSLKKLVPRSIT